MTDEQNTHRSPGSTGENPHHHVHPDPAGHDEHAGHGGHDEHAGHGGNDEHAGHGGHDGHAGHVAAFRRLFWIMLVFALPVVTLSGMFAHILGYALPDLPGITWVSPALGTVMYVWGGKPFLTGAVDELRARKPGMMLLIALAITVAFLSSWGSSLGLLSHELDFWWELALLIVIMLLGHWIEMRSLAQTSSALDSLAALLPDEAERVIEDTATHAAFAQNASAHEAHAAHEPHATHDRHEAPEPHDADVPGTERIERVAPSTLAVGDLLIVRPGGRVPADARIESGSADMDESMITGESRAVHREPGDTVIAGTVATDSGLRVRVTAVGGDTALAGIQRLVADAQASSSRAQRLADRAAGWLFWFALGSAIITALVWTLLGMPDDAVVRTITVLVIACPHALGLAIPLVVSIATERAARGGILITDRLALESMRGVGSVLFDKTGTLTRGEPRVEEIAVAAGSDLDEQAVLALAAAAESDSEHPLARAIVAAADERNLTRERASDFTSAPALGVRARVGTREIGVGGPGLLREYQAQELPAADEWRAQGAIILHVLADGVVIGALKLADEIRPESREAVEALQHLGIEPVMITGDAEAVAHAVAAELGITRVFAGVRPEDKAARVAELQAEGRVVAMVGDGVNDAPALARADVGIAIGAGTDVAIASAGVILASDDPRSVLSVIELSRASYRKMSQNLWWAAGYNLLSVPLAAGVLAPIGFVLPMSVGAILMSLSTIIVAANAQLLRRLDLSPEAGVRAARAR
ncbi:Cu2+-exporting ATPase [Mycetocola sp. BIGb0189]|uniref:heavy metal translocating P-type ATPase n=1 Tax=Mycetocola sp. BIGb0189 TaxID=2940604 RepID=UPI002169CE37|nr:heavy metal translocating P-type ATPase [Mycetocola sp. BIGb0189]MCS4277569.1 Cu2+-exporting ATPase [Mycetocola sp. BIGb0189]